MRNKFKKGAASFYIVAFSTLILMIVAISFATVIISEVERTSNDDLSQSAYDSALAGIEDAKLAYYNYQNCLAQEGVTATAPDNNVSDVTCGEILWYMNEANKPENADKCDTVWNILGKGSGVEGNVVEVKEGTNNMSQETTCIAMTDLSPNYRGNLSGSNMVDVIKLSFVDDVDVSDVTSIGLRWFSKEDAQKAVGERTNSKLNSGQYTRGFPIALTTAPPVVSLTLLQTGPEFTMDSFNQIASGQTNRGTLYFVPKSGTTPNSVGQDALVKSNDKTRQNNPIKVGCTDQVSQIQEFACSVTVGLPNPIGGKRNKNTFEIIISLPYGQPAAEFMLEFYCKNDKCGSETIQNESGETVSIATTKGMQVIVDSTGRANDLYRRVEVGLKNKNDLALTVMGPLELLDSGQEDAGLTKTWPVTEEYNFNP